MASEITYRIFVQLDNGDRDVAWTINDTNIDQAGTDFAYKTQNVGFAAAEALNLGEVTTPGQCVIQNLDPTNFVEVGYDDTGFKPTVKILPGKHVVLYFSTAAVAPQVKADTAACDIQYFLVEA